MMHCMDKCYVNNISPIKSKTSSERSYTFCTNYEYAVRDKTLVKPDIGVSNDDYDNIECDLIVHENQLIIDTEYAKEYSVIGLLGRGSYGYVYYSRNQHEFYALKIVKNHPNYTRQASFEINILRMLIGIDNCLQIISHFSYLNHLCIVTPVHGCDLYNYMRYNYPRGFPIDIIQNYSKQLLNVLCSLYDKNIIHCDIKPENILLKDNQSHDEIVLIDFGSATDIMRTGNMYIQSRYYRAPEVVKKLPYGCLIDVWSFGCLIMELLSGKPLFQAIDSRHLLDLINSLLVKPVQVGEDSDEFNPELFNFLSDYVPEPYLSTFYDWMYHILQPFQDQRFTPQEALMHPFLQTHIPPSNYS